METEKAIKKTLKFYKKDLEEFGVYDSVKMYAFMNFARKAIEFSKQEPELLSCAEEVEKANKEGRI